MNELEKGLLAVVGQYIEEEESLGDFVRLAINPETLETLLEADPDADDPAFDYYEMPDLLLMNPDGTWTPDREAIAEIAAEYQG